jgi:hypothetical protein
MSQQDAALGHHLDQVTGTELESEVSSHTQNDDLLVEVPPLEQILCRGRFCHAGRYRREPSFSSLHQNPLDNGHWSTATENHGRFVETCESTEVTVFRSGRIGQRVKRQKKGIWFLLIRPRCRFSSWRGTGATWMPVQSGGLMRVDQAFSRDSRGPCNDRRSRRRGKRSVARKQSAERC